MPRLKALAIRPEPEFPVLSRLLWQALALGALVALALLAVASGGASAFGVLPFWLLAAPAAALLTLHRRFLATAWRAHLVRATPRRRQRFGGSRRGRSVGTQKPRAPMAYAMSRRSRNSAACVAEC